MPTSRPSAFSPLVLFVLHAIAVPLVAQRDAQPRLVVPDAADVMIKTRHSSDRRVGFTTTETLYLKGARQRREERFEPVPLNGSSHWAFSGHALARISQCDQRRMLILNQDVKTYAYEPIADPAEWLARVRAKTNGNPQTPPQQALQKQAPPPPAAIRPTVTVTIDAVDTGERKPVGSYVARHVITTRTIDHGRGHVDIERQDGWYIDVPASNCLAGAAASAMLVPSDSMSMLPHVKFNVKGTAPRGYPVEETSHFGGRYPNVSRIELLEVSDGPLDPAVFDVPADYRPALPHPYGGYDLSKPDTFLNRAQAFRQVVADWTNYILRYGLQGILPGTTPPARY
jgi:hypothetical protein